jgi:hypothetical protein
LFGRAMEAAAQTLLKEMGTSVGTVWVPTSTADYSSFILTAADAPAEVVVDCRERLRHVD